MTPRDAATVALLRNGLSPEVFLLRRHSRSSFMANVWVYPGGQLDTADAAPDNHTFVDHLPDDATLNALAPDPSTAIGLCLAAIRETFEEANLLLGTPPDAFGSQAERARSDLHTYQTSLLDLARQFGLRFDLEGLAFFSHWVTPIVEPKRFDTRFFLAEAPGEQIARHDDQETTDSMWVTPGAALDLARDQKISLAPPTIRTLEELSNFETVSAAMAWAKTTRPPRLIPHFVDLDGSMTLLLPGDPEFPHQDYPEAQPVQDDITRMILREGFWVSARP